MSVNEWREVANFGWFMIGMSILMLFIGAVIAAFGMWKAGMI